MKSWIDIIVYIYLGALVIGAFGGLYHWPRQNTALRIATVLLISYVATEFLSFAFEHYGVATKIHHHILSSIEISIITCSYLALRKWLNARVAIFVILGSTIIVYISAAFIQPIESINTLILVFQGLFIALLATHALFVLMKNDDPRILEDPQFWFWTTMLMTNSVSVLHWGFFHIVEGKYDDLLEKMKTGHALVNMVFYLLLAYAMLILPRKRRFARERKRNL